MASERTPLLGQATPTLGRPLSLSSADGNEADDGGAMKGTNATSANGVRQNYYDEDAGLLSCNVFESVHFVYDLLSRSCDLHVPKNEMRMPLFTANITDPFEARIVARFNEPCIVYALLLVRLQFIREATSVLASSSMNETRAYLCELLACRMLRRQALEAKGSAEGMLAMARSLVGGFHAFQGASEEVLERIRSKEGYASRVGALSGAGKTNALELAILGKAREFIKNRTTQRVIKLIYDGKITYSSSSFIDILPDRWKNKQIALYNVREAPLLDHYRLRVPKYRSMIEFMSFLVLMASFILVIVDRHTREPSVSGISLMEVWFFIYALGYSLDKLASIAEHGWSVYSAGLTNGMDAASLPIYIAAFVLRVHSIVQNDPASSDRAYAILSCAACLLFPRLAFTAISNNLLILSLRALLADFVYLLGITVFCFIGFVFALNHLSEGDYSVGRISEWLVFIFFGLDGSGIDESINFDPVLGPILFVSFAALSNTLITSILVAILSTTYANVSSDAAAEDMFRKAVNCFEGVKSNALFDYVPPFNLVALAVLWPLSHVTSPRWFHKINVFATRTLSLPILLLIALYERQLAPEDVMGDLFSRLKVALTARLPTVWAEKLSLLEGAHWECEAVFDYTIFGEEKDSDADDFQEEPHPETAENEESWVGETGPDGQPRTVSTRASVLLDPSRIHRLQAQAAIDGWAQNTASAMLEPPGTLRMSPIPLSRQSSFARDSETGSTIRAAKPDTRPRLPHSPSAPIPSTTVDSTSPSPHNNPQQRFSLLDDPSPVFSDSPPSSPAPPPHRFPTSSSPPPKPNPTTHFAPLPTASRGGHNPSSGGSRDLRRSQTVSERLPPNAALNASQQRRRRMSVDDPNGENGIGRVEWPELSSSAPVRESPLARLYGHPGLNDDFDGGVGGFGGGGGAVRRRMSVGPATGHQRYGSEGAVGLSSSMRARNTTFGPGGGGGGANEPSTKEMMEMIKRLVATVARLEKKLDEKRSSGEDE
ncbi:hypothetical protein JCM8547_001050 [Rhodosporidiobolus lusitaniae]